MNICLCVCEGGGGGGCSGGFLEGITALPYFNIFYENFVEFLNLYCYNLFSIKMSYECKFIAFIYILLI